MANPMMSEIGTVRLDKWQCDDAERTYHIIKSGGTPGSNQCQSHAQNTTSSLVNEIAKARQHIQKSLNTDVTSGSADNILVSRLESVELDNKDLRKVTEDLQSIVKKLESRIAALELAGGGAPAVKTVEKPVSKQEEAGEDDSDDDDDDDDFELFGSGDEVDAEAERIKEERVAAYQAKKAKKPTLIAKSNVILDVKPWGDDTDMVALEKCVRSIEMDGLLWGTGKLVPVGYGIKKLTISTVVEDEKVSIEDLTDKIEEFEEHVQSVDIAAFNKI